MCEKQGDIVKPLREEIENNILWNSYKPFHYNFDIIQKIHFELEANKLLERHLSWFNSDTGEYACIALKKLVNTFVFLNKNRLYLN